LPAPPLPHKGKRQSHRRLAPGEQAKRHFALDELKLIESINQEISVARTMPAVRTSAFEDRRAQQNEQGIRPSQPSQIRIHLGHVHELRTPLNVIMGNAELTGDGFWGPINDEQENSMEKIRHHARFLLKLVNDVLALSRLDAKKCRWS
jgi:signal transduction histidine kinase